MPHLSPISWPITMLSLWLLLLLLTTHLWWLQLPTFPPIHFPPTPPSNKLWPWK